MLRNSILRQTRLFSTSPITHKTLVESAKDTINKAAKTVSDATASGIAKTEQMADAAKRSAGMSASDADAKMHETKGDMSHLTGQTKGDTSNLTGKAKGDMSDLTGQAKGKANELMGEAKGKANELMGEAKGKKNEIKGDMKGKM